MSHGTVLQQGDVIGSEGEKGEIGGPGEPGVKGADGQFTNVLSVEIVYKFTLSSVTLTKIYVVEQGAAGFWIASASHNYTNSGFNVIPATTTISGFLQDTTKKFNVHLELIAVEDKSNNPASPLVWRPVTAEIFKTIDDEIIIRPIGISIQTPISFNDIINVHGIGGLKFSLLIIGTDA